MQVYQVKDEVMEVLVAMVKGLSRQIRVFKEIVNVDEDSVPNSYILLRSQITDSADNYGDGKGILRVADCDIMLVSKGYADKTTDLHNVNKKKLRNHLRNQDVEFTETNLGYDENTKSTQHTFSVKVKYGIQSTNA